MIFALLPVKPPHLAKQRLSAVLAPQDRETLASMMFEHVFNALCAARGLDRIVVITGHAPAAVRAQSAGALVFDDPEILGHKNTADRAARRTMELGASIVLMVPIDLPLVTAAEFDELISAARRLPKPGALLVPSFDGSGTNVLALSPPDAIESCFGENSFRGHVAEARARRVPLQVLHLPGLVLDLDTPEDIAELLARAPESKFAQLLRSKCPSKS